MATHSETSESNVVQVELDHGVMVARIQSKTLLFELAINEIEDQILEALPDAKCAVLVDCAELTLHVSSQFLSMLVRVHRPCVLLDRFRNRIPDRLSRCN